MHLLKKPVKILTERPAFDVELPGTLFSEFGILTIENRRTTFTWSDTLLPLQKPALKKAVTKANEKALSIHTHSVIFVRLLYGLLTLSMVRTIEGSGDTFVRSGVSKPLPHSLIRGM